jgi:hypothetical protein
MAASEKDPAPARQVGSASSGAGLSMPDEHRARAKAHAAALAETAARVALELPMSADVDDFRRVLAAGAKP